MKTSSQRVLSRLKVATGGGCVNAVVMSVKVLEGCEDVEVVVQEVVVT